MAKRPRPKPPRRTNPAPYRRRPARPKLDPRLAMLLAYPLKELQRREPGPFTTGFFFPGKRKAAGPADLGEPYVSVFIDCDASVSDLRKLGVIPRSSSGNIVTAFVPVALIARLEGSDAVGAIELSRPMSPGVEQAVAYAGMNTLHNATPPVKGRGVIIGVIDNDFDIYHRDLRNADGTTRLLFLWDQSLAAQGTESPPAPYTYGVAYDAATINAELSQPAGAPPYQTVRHVCRPAGHGTQVAGLAIGTGFADPAAGHIGAAPEADLICVNMAFLGGRSFPDSVGAADALSYVFARADELGRPAVVNMSIYDNQGPHDGTSLAEQFIDGLLVVGGRAATLITGNSQGHRMYAEGEVATGATAPLQLRFDPPGGSSHRPETAEIWYDGHDRMSVTVSAPDGTTLGPIAAGGGGVSTTTSGNVRISVASVVGDARNGDNVIAVMLDVSGGAPLTGDWALALTGDSVINGHFEAFLDRQNSPRSRWLPPYQVGTRRSLGHPSACRRAIVVGGHYKNGPPPGDYPATGRGPTRDGRVKPDICAVSAALATCRGRDMRLPDPGDPYITGIGTSMAAPLVAGACALLFECRGADASSVELKQIIQDHAGLPATTVPSNFFGFGYLRIGDACAAPAPQVDVWMRDNEQDTGNEPSLGISWLSPDIEILDAAGTPVPNPVHDASQRFTTIVRVTVRNRGARTARNVEAFLHWADPATNIPYPSAWNTTGIFTGAPAFNAVTNRILIPQVAAGAAVPIDFAWAPPAPGANLTGDSHFCLLVRIEQDLDPSSVNAGGWPVIPADNNLGLRNVHVLPNSTGGDAVSSFYVVGSNDDDGLWVRPVLEGGSVTLNIPTAALPWRDLAAVEKHGARDPLAGRKGRIGQKELEERTGIRGAVAMSVAHGIATIELREHTDLLIPQLRLAAGGRLPVSVAVTGIKTAGKRRFVHVGQRSGGRSIGGVTLELRKGLPHRRK